MSPPKCRSCGGRGVRWRTLGRTRTSEPCPTCDGTGVYERTQPFRGRKEEARGETTRAALADGPTREHGDPADGGEGTTPA